MGVFVGGRKRKNDKRNVRYLCLKKMENNYYIE